MDTTVSARRPRVNRNLLPLAFALLHPAILLGSPGYAAVIANAMVVIVALRWMEFDGASESVYTWLPKDLFLHPAGPHWSPVTANAGRGRDRPGAHSARVVPTSPQPRRRASGCS